MTSRTIDLPAGVAFDRLTALRNHERLIPLTTIEAPARRPQVGDVVVATTAGLIIDTMELVRYEPPASHAVGRATWIKQGPALHGEAEILVTRLSEGACRVDWVERDIRIPGQPLTTRPLTAATGVMTRLALARFDRLVRASTRNRPPRG
ncbi:hypothetical protein, partial [Pseudactinotalea sp.]|uniref:hypothetical protein n=1 Tax=Pseudactinotalea sp. TaxID=1926260 RepID=UPI003B3B6910